MSKLLLTISKLSKGEREFIAKTRLLNQRRGITLKLKKAPKRDSPSISSLEYVAKLVSHIELHVLNFDLPR